VRRTGIALAAAAMLLLLTGCQPIGIVDGPSGAWQVKEIDTPNGGTVVCVLYTNDVGHGLSCDWNSWTPVVEEGQ
jgi:hypothetical protein